MQFLYFCIIFHLIDKTTNIGVGDIYLFVFLFVCPDSESNANQ